MGKVAVVDVGDDAILFGNDVAAEHGFSGDAQATLRLADGFELSPCSTAVKQVGCHDKPRSGNSRTAKLQKCAGQQ